MVVGLFVITTLCQVHLIPRGLVYVCKSLVYLLMLTFSFSETPFTKLIVVISDLEKSATSVCRPVVITLCSSANPSKDKILLNVSTVVFGYFQCGYSIGFVNS